MADVVEYPKAMWSPEGQEKTITTAEQEKALRKDGWIDGTEWWTRKNAIAAGQSPVAAPPTEKPKGKKK